MWVIRGGERNRLVDRFVDEGVIGVGYAVPDAEILTRTEMRRFLVESGASKGVDDDVAMLSAFVNEIQVGESVLMPDDERDEVVVGEVTSRYEHHDDVPAELHQHRRTVTWIARHRIGDLPAALRKVATPRQDLVQDRSAEWSGHVAKVRAGELGRDPADRRPVVRSTSTTRSTRSTTPRAPRAPRKPPAPKAAPVADRTCPSCHLRKPARQFVGEYCVDCAE